MKSEIHKLDDYQSERPVRVIPDTKYPKMYRLQWANGDISVRYWDKTKKPYKDGGPHTYGLYNLTRANDILRNWDKYVSWENKRLANPSTELTHELF